MTVEPQQIGDTILGTTFLSAGAWSFIVETALPGYVMIAGGLLLTLRIVQISFDILEKAKKKDDPS